MRWQQASAFSFEIACVARRDGWRDMLRTNLSTRPFYNERGVHLLLLLVALIVGGATLVNVFKLLQFSRQNTELSTNVNRDRAEADRLTRDAARIRRGINQEELQLVVNAAREANVLIDQRTFSWTALFNRIEETLPPDVMLTSLQPIVDETGTRISMTVLSRRTVDVDEFMEKLEATGAFENVLQRQDEDIEGGMIRAIIDTDYVPEGAEAPEAEPDPNTTKPSQGQPPAKPASKQSAAVQATTGGRR
jgi:Tfp pilus assembly protein PilN